LTSSLLLAAECSHKAVVELLLPTGAFDINAVDGDGDTAIHIAATKGHEDVVRVLLDVPGVDPTIISRTDGHTALSVAQLNGHSSIVELLQEFESRKVASPGLLGLNQPSLSSCVNEDDSDSDGSEIYQDAEERLEDEE
jgi:ankyrin repeat protein